ncbi:MAG: ROK family sugar kinase or transcriptional regulator [uncultured Cytophagales bacterium]|uniref:ROK family sugar kinase or transcriptional regulator n=1 Tax=uncultured Cytophagales bacterium TaxID=158755 RepID=A0A6J4HIH0_9SPHI|nr:MAG: ROK family sugar kinase or transcriptional regulator [uncultured Cytophagales bacterium]
MHTEPLLAGIEIGGTKLQVVLGGPGGTIQRRQRLPVDRVRGAEGIRAAIEATFREWNVSPAAVGVGFGGPVDWRTGRIATSHQVPGWSGFELGQWLTGKLGCPAFVENDANVAALAEALAGAGAGYANVFYVTLGSGVGGGLVVNGGLYHGALPGETEVGHLRLDRGGTTLESRCSGWAVDGRIREAIGRHPESTLAQLVGTTSPGEARFLGPALERGDALAQSILRETAVDLAFGLSHVVHLLHPEVIILGGGLSLLGEPLRSAMQAHLPPLLMESFRPGPAVTTARLGEDAVPVGALVLAAARYRETAGV